MKTKYIIPLFAALLAAGCSDGDGKAALPNEIRFGIGEIGTTRAAVDRWSNTTVSVAYAFGLSATLENSFDLTLTEDIRDLQINTGLVYPENGTEVRFVGYHPAAVPVYPGIVTYDISKGDADVMFAKEISGNYTNQIGSLTNNSKLNYEHLLTRITFRMVCAPGSDYPEPVLGVIVKSATPDLLMTYARLDLNNQMLSFFSPNAVLAGGGTSHTVPPYGSDPLVIDAMVQPGIPLAFTIQTLTGVQKITITDPSNSYWVKLTQQGGEAGKQYVISLQFSGVGILDQDITMVDWQTGRTVAGEGEIIW